MPIMPRGGTATWARHRKSCRSSRAVGVLKEVTSQPCGLMPEKMCRMVPSLPAVSMPCRTIRSAYCWPA